MRIALLSLTLGVAACAQTPAQVARQATADADARASLDRELTGLVAGPPQSCIEGFQARDVKAFGSTLVYRTSGSMRYVTQTSGCEGVGRDNILVTRSTTSQLCRGDIATTVDRFSHFTTGGCSFGDFTPYRRR